MGSHASLASGLASSPLPEAHAAYIQLDKIQPNTIQSDAFQSSKVAALSFSDSILGGMPETALGHRVQYASGGARSLTQAINMAKRRYPGRVLSAKTRIARNGKAVYRIKILSKSGEIRTITIPSSAAAKQRSRG